MGKFLDIVALEYFMFLPDSETDVPLNARSLDTQNGGEYLKPKEFCIFLPFLKTVAKREKKQRRNTINDVMYVMCGFNLWGGDLSLNQLRSAPFKKFIY